MFNVGHFFFRPLQKLEYLTDSSSKAQVSSKLTDGSKIQERLKELLKTKSSSDDDQMIHEWIQVRFDVKYFLLILS